MTYIEISGNRYACHITMGALRRFKQQTGKEPSEIGSDTVLLSEFLYCCVKSAANANGTAFDWTVDDFCDRLDLPTLQEWAESLTADAPTEQKKTASKRQ